MRENIAVAEELGFLIIPKGGTLVELDELNRLPDEKTVLLTTGSQGEPMAALTRMANNDHRQVEIRSGGDTVIISATPIPGNESLVGGAPSTICFVWGGPRLSIKKWPRYMFRPCQPRRD